MPTPIPDEVAGFPFDPEPSEIPPVVLLVLLEAVALELDGIPPEVLLVLPESLATELDGIPPIAMLVLAESLAAELKFRSDAEPRIEPDPKGVLEELNPPVLEPGGGNW